MFDIYILILTNPQQCLGFQRLKFDGEMVALFYRRLGNVISVVPVFHDPDPFLHRVLWVPSGYLT